LRLRSWISEKRESSPARWDCKLPAYAPELNPVEYIWGRWKQHELPNVCLKDYWQLSQHARRTLRRMRRRPTLMTAFWKQAFLFE
jgi:transposase